ncbi:MAG: YebC/PmpR family DNA-binding transcriptional regulator [Chloroflexaceae bacterium]|nr:YebC/PmpR family DNA-binding transcriptional regulator [Chloroflexaceae bacterium]NJO06291.1 YebC/PmpR family DNA-binding transcriptional regulator [Chloroflexaceae bacterium]
MSGHTKWHTIRRAKGAVDQKRGQLFTKLARDITMAVREGGGGDPEFNFRLRLTIDKAKQNNMSNDGIQRAIDRGLGKGSDGAMEETVFYEGYAPGGVAVLIEAATDNRNRTSADVRYIMNKNGGSPGEPGSVAWMFQQKGLISIDLDGVKMDAEELTLLAIDAGAEDVEVSDDVLEVYTEWTELNSVRQKLADQGIAIRDAEMMMRPTTLVTPEEEDAVKVMRLLEKLEDLDDVQRVFSNLDITDELVAKLD